MSSPNIDADGVDEDFQELRCAPALVIGQESGFMTPLRATDSPNNGNGYIAK